MDSSRLEERCHLPCWVSVLFLLFSGRHVRLTVRVPVMVATLATAAIAAAPSQSAQPLTKSASNSDLSTSLSSRFGEGAVSALSARSVSE